MLRHEDDGPSHNIWGRRACQREVQPSEPDGNGTGTSSPNEKQDYICWARVTNPVRVPSNSEHARHRTKAGI